MENNIYNNNQDTINLRDLLFKYLKKWYWFVLAVLVSFIVAWFYLKTVETKYNVSSTIMLRNENGETSGDQMAIMESMGLFNGSKSLEDEIQVINSHKIIKQAIDTLNLYTEYYKKDKLRYVQEYKTTPIEFILPKNFCDTLKYPILMKISISESKALISFKSGNILEKYQLSNINEIFETPLGKFNFISKGKITNAKYKVIVYPSNSLIAGYSSKIQAGATNKQTLNVIKISMIESNIKKAEDFLNKIVELYNLDAIVDKNLVASNTAIFLNDQLENIKNELTNVETNVEKYKKNNQITDISSEATIYLESSSEYGKKTAELETQLRLTQYLENYIKNTSNQYSLIPTNIGLDDRALVTGIEQYNLAILERLKLIKSSGKSNPALLDLEEQINAMRTNISTTINSVRGGLNISRNDVGRKENEFNSRIRAVPTKERQYLEIKRQQEITQNLYIFLYQKRIENALKLASTASAARTIDKAYASLSPVSPKKGMIYLTALFFGLILPFLYIYLKDIINNKIVDSREFQQMIKAPYLGNVCISREIERVVVEEGKVSPIVEMFRLIRTNLQFITAQKKNPVILVTSTISGEGKSFISINLAMSFALLKKKVVVVGLDIRNPMLGEYLHIPKDKGITLYLSDNSYKLEDVVVPSKFHPFLDVIPAGPIPPNPSELILSSRLEEIFDELKKQYEYIIVDSAPIGVVSDTYLLSRVIDNSVYVARQDYTPHEASNLINEIYEEKKLKDMGVILNGTPATSNYGYGYGYGSDYRRKQSKRAAPKITFGDKINDLLYKLFN